MADITRRLERLEENAQGEEDFPSFMRAFARDYVRAYGGDEESIATAFKTREEFHSYIEDLIKRVWGVEKVNQNEKKAE
jgi:hypothetical protein